MAAHGTLSEFQSTPPVKAATSYRIETPIDGAISIHAAREGGDTAIAASIPISMLFQSTPPVKAATRTQAGRTAKKSHFNPRRP